MSEVAEAECCFRSKWREGIFLTGAIIRYVWYSCVDTLYCLLKGDERIPISARDLLGKNLLLSRLCGRRVIRVVEAGDKPKAGSESLGAGGTGTDRLWLRVDFVVNSKPQQQLFKTERVFVKLPASTLFEGIFLTIFGVYLNEIKFYKRLMEDEAFRMHFPQGLFPATLAVGRNRNRFVIVLEDLAGRRDAVLPTVASAHPISQVKMVLKALAELHAPFFAKHSFDQGYLGWTDLWSRPHSKATRPPFLRLVADSSLRGLDRRFPHILSQDCRTAYLLFVQHFQSIRAAWSSHPHLTLTHGDSHLGNCFFYGDRAGFYDFQCVALEHPCRDLVYHLLSSCDPTDLEAGGERFLVDFYVQELNLCLEKRHQPLPSQKEESKSAHGNELPATLERVPAVDDDTIVNDNTTPAKKTKKAPAHHAPFLSAEEAWEQYRSHAIWVLVAFVICAGAGEHYFTDTMAKLTLSRIVKGCDRLDTLGALRLLLAREARRTKAALASPPNNTKRKHFTPSSARRGGGKSLYDDRRRAGGRHANVPYLSP